MNWLHTFYSLSGIIRYFIHTALAVVFIFFLCVFSPFKLFVCALYVCLLFFFADPMNMYTTYIQKHTITTAVCCNHHHIKKKKKRQISVRYIIKYVTVAALQWYTYIYVYIQMNRTKLARARAFLSLYKKRCWTFYGHYNQTVSQKPHT